MTVPQRPESDAQLVTLIETAFQGIDNARDAMATIRRSLSVLRAELVGEDQNDE